MLQMHRKNINPPYEELVENAHISSANGEGTKFTRNEENSSTSSRGLTHVHQGERLSDRGTR